MVVKRRHGQATFGLPLRTGGRTLAAYELGGRVLAALGTSPTEIRMESAFLKACREASFSEGDLYEGIEMRDIFGRGFFPLVNKMIFNHHVHLSRAVATRRAASLSRPSPPSAYQWSAQRAFVATWRAALRLMVACRD